MKRGSFAGSVNSRRARVTQDDASGILSACITQWLLGCSCAFMYGTMSARFDYCVHLLL